MRQWAFFLFLVISAGRLWAADAPAAMADVSYSDMDDPFYQEQYRGLRHRIEACMPAAMTAVLRSDVFSHELHLSMSYRLRAPLRIEIRVIPEETLYHALAGTAGWRYEDGHWIHVLTLNIAGYMQNPTEKIQDTVSHELAHIFLGDVMGVDDIQHVPMWLNEGLAQSVTNEGRTRLQMMRKSFAGQESMLRLCSLDAPVDTFAHGEGNFECYPEYFVASRDLRRLRPGVLAEFLKALNGHQSVAEAFESTTGKDYESFQQDVDRDMINEINGRSTWSK